MTIFVKLNRFEGAKMKSLFALILFFSLFVACTTQPEKKDPVIAGPQYTELFESAKKDLQLKKTSLAIKKFNKVINDAPETEVAAQSHIALGDYYYSSGRTNDALAHFMSVLNGTVRVSSEPIAGIKAAQCLFSMDKVTEALSVLDNALKSKSIQNETLVDGLKLRLQILKRINAPLEELKTNLHLYSNVSSAADKQEYKISALAITESQLSTEQLTEVARDSKYGFVQPPALFRLGLSHFEKSDFSSARSAFAQVRDLVPNTELADRANELLIQIDARESVNPKRVGVVLPLSGKLSKIGYKALRGIQLGLGVFGKNKSSFELAVIDSGGNPSSARRAVEKLVTEDHVVAIIGSLSSKEASALATKCQEFGVPGIVLSQKAGITEIGDFVFRNSLTSEMQVKRLAQEAIANQGLKRFAILYPKDPYGAEYANLFWDEVLRLGGEVRAVQSYNPGETDFNAPIKKIVGTFDASARQWEYKLRYEEWKKNLPSSARKQTPPQDLLPSIVDFDAIFIPDSAKALGQIAPMLAYHDVRDTTLIGTNLWNSNAIIERAGKYLKKSLFVDSFLAGDPVLTNSDFFRNYSQTFAETPEEFDLQAFDSALIIRKALEAGASNRAELQRSLQSMNGVPGGVGVLNMTEKREVSRPLVVLTISDNKIIRASNLPPSQH